MPATEAWPEGTRSDVLINRSVLGVGAVVFAWLALDGWWSLIVGVAGAGLALAMGLLDDAPHLLLADGVLEVRGRRPRRLRLDRVVEVKTDWLPYRDSEIVFMAARGSISCRLNAETAPFVHAVGEALLPFRRAIHASPSAARALGWPERHRQTD